MILTCSLTQYRHYIYRARFVAYCIEPPDPNKWPSQIRQMPELYPDLALWNAWKAGKTTYRELLSHYEKEILPKIDLRDYFWLRCSKTAAQNVILLSHEKSTAKLSLRKSIHKIFEKRDVSVREWSRTGPENDDDFRVDVNERKHVFLED